MCGRNMVIIMIVDSFILDNVISLDETSLLTLTENNDKHTSETCRFPRHRKRKTNT